MHIIPNLEPLSQETSKTFRVALQGAGGTGKTTSAVTAPNPVFADIDNSLDKHNADAAGVDISKIQRIPFYRSDFLKSVGGQNSGQQPNIRDAFKRWLTENISKFEPEQTFVLDSWTFLQDAFDRQGTIEPYYNSYGKEDTLAFWAEKQDYSALILNLLQSARCNVVVIFHEVSEYDDKGRPTGKVTPMMQGKFAHRLQNYFPYWFRQIGMGKIADTEAQKKEASLMGITHNQFKRLQDSCPKTQSFYAWQVATTAVATCKTKIPFPRFIPSTFDVFANPEKYIAP